jgi:hypothetical protein
MVGLELFGRLLVVRSSLAASGWAKMTARRWSIVAASSLGRCPSKSSLALDLALIASCIVLTLAIYLQNFVSLLGNESHLVDPVLRKPGIHVACSRVRCSRKRENPMYSLLTLLPEKLL